MSKSSAQGANQKGLRTPERMFRIVLWFVAVIFAAFLIGLGSLVVRDLPTVDGHIELSDFVDKAKAEPLDVALHKSEDEARVADERIATLDLKVQSSQSAYDTAKQAFDNWIAARTSTQRSDQDPEVIRRTHELDVLSAATRKAEVAVEEARASQLEMQQKLAATQRARSDLDDAARDTYDAAVRKLELHVFLIRLAITLPPLAIAGWLFVKARKSTWWPFVWGFVFFAVFTFFFELVPYLPSYGGYVRYLIGILATIVAGRYAMVAMQRYLERQRVAEQQSEAVRRQSLSYEHAIKSTNAGICPGCERGFKVHDGQTNFCMHCGMKLYEHCPVCTSRRNAFFHFCPTCGTDKPNDPSPRPPAVTELAPAV